MRKRFTLSGTCLHSWSVQEPPLVPKQRSRNMCKGLWQNFWAAMLFKVAASQYPWTDGSRGERSTSNQKSLWWFRTGSSKVVWDWRWAAWKFDQWQKRKERKKRKEESKKEGRKEGRKERKKEGKKERKKGTRSNNSAAATDGLWPAEAETLCYRIRVFDRAKFRTIV